MGAIKTLFDKIGEGLHDIGDAISHGLEGLGRVVGGALTMNPGEIGQGLGDVAQGAEDGLEGAGQLASGAAGRTPLGFAVDAMMQEHLDALLDGNGNGSGNGGADA